MRYLYLLVFVAGCNSQQLTESGQAAQSISPAITAANPEIGAAVFVIGGLLLAAGAFLKKKGK